MSTGLVIIAVVVLLLLLLLLLLMLVLLLSPSLRFLSLRVQQAAAAVAPGRCKRSQQAFL
jgi:hypothetical protein